MALLRNNYFLIYLVNVNSQPLLTTSSLKVKILRQHFSGAYKCIKTVRIKTFNTQLNKTEEETKVFTEIHSVIFNEGSFNDVCLYQPSQSEHSAPNKVTFNVYQTVQTFSKVMERKTVW